MNKKTPLKIIFLALLGFSVFGWERQPHFEATSLRLQPDAYVLDVAKMDKIGLTYGNGTVDFYMASMSRMVRLAYGVKEYQLPRAKWFKNKYSGRATFSKETPAEEIPAMVRTMLEERFGFRAHIESKMAKVWLLEQGPGGAKLAPPSRKAMFTPGVPFPSKLGEADRTGNSDPQRGWLMMSSGTIQTFCDLLSKEAGRPVVDRTGLKGLFDIFEEVHYAFPMQVPPPSMTIPKVEIVQPPLVLGPVLKRLGLRFREGQAPVESLVVDSEPSLVPKS